MLLIISTMPRSDAYCGSANLLAQLRIISIRTPNGNSAKNSSISPGGNGVGVVVMGYLMEWVDCNMW